MFEFKFTLYFLLFMNGLGFQKCVRLNLCRKVQRLECSTRVDNIFSKSNQNNTTKHLFSVAPMMDYTDCHQHRLQRLLSSQSILYTEMIGASSLVYASNCDRFLKGYLADLESHEIENVVLQLGGSSVTQMAISSKIAVKQYGYKEINIKFY